MVGLSLSLSLTQSVKAILIHCRQHDAYSKSNWKMVDAAKGDFNILEVSGSKLIQHF
ncbi:hypothetical protein A2U01_0032158, partial [Trifolium medium]|nr:hypothetical protein [Trifolium medium]